MESLGLIGRTDQFRKLCDDLARCQRVAFDTEFVPEYTFVPQLCLIQVATDQFLALVDPLEIDNVGRFWEVLLEPGKQVVVHAGREEMSFCLQETGRLPENVFDVQLASGFGGYGYPTSLANLIHRVAGATVSTAETRTDWRKRPLSEKQIRYALDDVRYLLQIRDVLAQKLDAKGRTGWLADEIHRSLAHVQNSDAVERFRKLPGSGRLSPRQLAVLREISAWRNVRARSMDKPARWILRDDILVELAKHQPSNVADLKRTRGIGEVGKGKWAEELIAAIERGRAVPDEVCPERADRRDSPDRQMVQKILGAALIQLSQTHGVAPQLLGSNDDVKELIEYEAERDSKPPASEDDLPRLLRGWRAEVCGGYLASLLHGETVFRVKPTDGEFKLVFEAPEPTA